MALDTTKVGYGATAPDHSNVRQYPNLEAPIIATVTGFIGVATTQYQVKPDGVWYEFNLNLPGYVTGWVRSDVFVWNKLPFMTKEAAQTDLDKLLSNNKKILANLLIASNAVAKLKAAGINATDSEKKIFNLGTRLAARNKKIVEQPGIVGQQEGTNKELSAFSGDLEKIMNENRVGIAPLIIWAAIVIIAAVSSYITYYYMHNAMLESEIDYKESEEITNIINKLSPQDQETLRKYNSKQVKEAYTKGYNSSTFGTLITTVKYAAFFVGGIYLYKTYVQK